MRHLLLIGFFATVFIAVNGESGNCCFYGPGYKPGSPTACETPFDENSLTAAHATLACGTKVHVRNLDNGKTVDVTINDRSPPGIVLDLTTAAFGKVENPDKGLFKCDYEII